MHHFNVSRAFWKKVLLFDKKHESHQEKELLCFLQEQHLAQKEYSLFSTLRFLTAYVALGFAHGRNRKSE